MPAGVQPYREVPLVRYFLLCLLSLSAARAQTTPASDKNAAEMTSQDAPVSFKAKVNLVLVPVVARDRQGRAVGNLRQEDFQLFDRGKPQTITKFSMETLGQRRGVEPQVPAGAAVTPQEPQPEYPDRFVAYLFDDVHLETGDLMRVRTAAERHLSASLHPSDRAAVYTTSGQTMLDFTDDREKLREALLRIRPQRPLRMTECPDMSYYLADAIQNKNDEQARESAIREVYACAALDQRNAASRTVAEGEVRRAAQQALTEGDRDTRLALGTLRSIVRRMSAMPGQRSMLLVSPGFFLTFDHMPQLPELLDAAIRSGVVIGALDARGLYTDVEGADVSGVSTADFAATRRMYRSAGNLAQSSVLAELASGTGGVFFQNSNDLEEGFRRAAGRPEYFYVLGFSPQNLKLDGKYHTLKVTLKSEDKLVVQARRGYYAPRSLADPAETAKQEIEEALFSRDEMHELPVTLQTQFFKPGDQNARLSVLVRVDVKALRYRKAEGRNRNDLTIVAALFDRNGNYVQAIQKTLEMRLRDETLEKKLQSGVTVKSTFDTAPGTYMVRLVVRDAEDHLMSAENSAVEIP